MKTYDCGNISVFLYLQLQQYYFSTSNILLKLTSDILKIATYHKFLILEDISYYNNSPFLCPFLACSNEWGMFKVGNLSTISPVGGTFTHSRSIIAYNCPNCQYISIQDKKEKYPLNLEGCQWLLWMCYEKEHQNSIIFFSRR